MSVLDEASGPPLLFCRPEVLGFVVRGSEMRIYVDVPKTFDASHKELQVLEKLMAKRATGADISGAKAKPLTFLFGPAPFTKLTLPVWKPLFELMLRRCTEETELHKRFGVKPDSDAPFRYLAECTYPGNADKSFLITGVFQRRK